MFFNLSIPICFYLFSISFPLFIPVPVVWDVNFHLCIHCDIHKLNFKLSEVLSCTQCDVWWQKVNFDDNITPSTWNFLFELVYFHFRFTAYLYVWRNNQENMKFMECSVKTSRFYCCRWFYSLPIKRSQHLILHNSEAIQLEATRRR